MTFGLQERRPGNGVKDWPENVEQGGTREKLLEKGQKRALRRTGIDRLRKKWGPLGAKEDEPPQKCGKKNNKREESPLCNCATFGKE